MRIQHNIAALNSYRNLTGNNNAVSKNLEKLSSGYRINRAGDDAAGLAISEKMRAQITGLNTAQKNAQDGVSLVQTAEGALTEVHSMLNRMVELADQSANGTYDNAVDRANLQKEITSLKSEIDRIADSEVHSMLNRMVELADQSANGTYDNAVDRANLQKEITSLKSEIDRIADSTNFNGIDLLNGDLSTSTTSTVTSKEDATGKKAGVDLKFTFADQFKDGGNLNVTVAKGTQGDPLKVVVANTGVITITADVEKSYSADDIKTALANADVTAITDATQKAKVQELLATVSVTGSGIKGAAGYTAIDNGTGTAAGPTGKALTLQIGDTSADFNQMKVSVGDMHTKALGIDGIDISNQAGAKAAVDKIKAAINSVSSTRGDLGAIQNRLEHTINNLSVTAENMTAAESRIRDVDMKAAINSVSSTRGDLGAIQNRLEHTINNLSVTAENMTAAESRIRDVDMANEMMAYTKNNILVQSSQAMLAQANQIPQGVLQLLQ